MADYIPINDFSAKDALISGDPNKIIRGAEVDAETAAAATAIASKPDQEELQDQDFVFAIASGTDVYTATLAPAITAYTQGMAVELLFTNANTTTATINLNGVGPVSIRNNQGGVLSAGNIAANMVVRLVYDGTNFQMQGGVASSGVTLPRGYIDGFITRPDPFDTLHDIEFGAGECIDSSNTLRIALSSVLTKQIDSGWVEGDDMGGFPSGESLTADTWYHLFVIFNPTTGVTDAGYDPNLDASSLLADATGYTVYRRVGSVLTDGGSNIVQYRQDGEDFTWDVPFESGQFTPSTAGTNRVIETPLGIKVKARIYGRVTDGGIDGLEANVVLYDPDITGSAATATHSMANSFLFFTAYVSYGTYNTELYTNTSSEVVVRRMAGGSTATAGVNVMGWTDRRGKE